MSHHQLIILLLIILAVVYLLLKKDDPYPAFKKWLVRHPHQQQKLEQAYWDQFFIDPHAQEVQVALWKMATFELPTPTNLLPGNKVLISIIREYLREQQGINPPPNLMK